MFIKKAKWKVLKTNLGRWLNKVCRSTNLSLTFTYFSISIMQCVVLAIFTSVCTSNYMCTASVQANQEGLKVTVHTSFWFVLIGWKHMYREEEHRSFSSR
jgi:hypothetical protein